MRRSRWGALIGVGLVVAACGGKADDQSASNDADYQEPSPFFHSGSRLKAHVLRAPKAPPVLVEIIDSKYGRPCEFRWATDGELRCLPRELVIPAAYADTECTVPMIAGGSTFALRSSSCTDMPDHASTRTTDCDSEKRRVFQIEPMEAPAEEVYLSKDTCELGLLTHDHLFALVDEVDAAEFVSADVQEREVSAQLARRVLVAEDGSEWPHELVAVPQSVPCEPVTEEGYGYLVNSPSDAPVFCGPEKLAYDVSLDTSCTDDEGTVAFVTDECLGLGDEPPKYVRGPDAWWEVSPEPLAVPVFGQGLMDVDECVELAENTFFGVATMVSAAAWPALDRAQFGEGPIQVSGFTHDGAAVQIDSGRQGFFDSERSLDCEVYDSPVGIVCIPGLQVEVDSYVYYADSQQKQRLFAVPRDTGEELRSRIYPTHFSDESPECYSFLRTEAVYTLGAGYSGPVYETSGGPASAEVVEFNDFYVLSDALPWSDFVRLREVTE